MAEGTKEGEDGFSFVDKVRLMMYSEQEKEAFLIEKKEKEEKKKAKETAKTSDKKTKQEKRFGLRQIKSFFFGEAAKEPKTEREEALPPQNETDSPIEDQQAACEKV